MEKCLLVQAIGDTEQGRRVVVLHGEAGIGKTELLRGCAAEATRRGFRVVEAAGVPVLLTALLASGTAVPEAIRTPIDRWLADDPRAPGPATLRLAVLALVLHLCRTSSVMIAVDDMAEDDAAMVSLLMFVVRRLRRERLLVVFAVRSLHPFGRAGAEVLFCPVPPLSPGVAAGLLDGLPRPPRRAVRAEILHYAGGNPQALRELAAAADGATRPALPPDYRISLDSRLARTFAAGLSGLPASTRRLLLFAATAEHDNLDEMLVAAGATLADCGPAEQARLISIVAGRLTFAHPMVRAVCYFTAPFGERQEAHARLASVLPEQSGRRDWHLANLGGIGSDLMAAAMERAAEVAAAAGRGLEVAGLFERAAGHSSDPREAARRYGLAAAEADRCGDIEWSLELWNRVVDRTDDPDLLASVIAGLGNKQMFRASAGTLALTERLVGVVRDPGLALSVLTIAARSVLTDGDPAGVAVLRRLVAGFPFDERRSPAQRALVESVADPVGWAGRHGSLRDSGLLRPLAGAAERARLLTVGGVAWAVDENDIAADYYRRALDLAQADGSIGVVAAATVAVTEALLDLGVFGEADALLGDAADLVGANPASPVRRAILAQQATVAIVHGAPERARALLDEAGDPAAPESALVRYLMHRAAGRLAAADGDHEAAYRHHSHVFTADGTPIHYLLSQRSVVDLAGAAVAAGRTDEARTLLERARERCGRANERRDWAWEAALALLDLDGGDTRLLALLDVPKAGLNWPYEHAVVQAWAAGVLRSRRRSNDARPLLLSALATFVRQGAVRDAESVRGELRATGVRATPTGLGAFDDLTAQQQQITRLASRGLSNREIAEHLGLSSRTIGFYLYQIYPKLGIARRDQLRDVVPAGTGG